MPDFDELLKMPVVYKLPGMDQVTVNENIVYRSVAGRDLLMDIYYPPDMREGEARPAVLFVHGLGPEEIMQNPKNWGQYLSWGRLTAASGLIAVTFNHRNANEQSELQDAGSDVDALFSYVRTHAAELRIDADRLAIWCCSAGVPLGTRSALRGAPPFVRCLVAYYGPLDMRDIPFKGLTDEVRREFSAITYLEHEPEALPPMLIARAGQDWAELNAAIDRFVARALEQGVTFDLLTHPRGQHAFDARDDVPRSHEIIARTLDFMKTHLHAAE